MTQVNPLQERLIDFGAAVILSLERLPRRLRWRQIVSQLSRCGTSPAAHYAEATGAESPRDFVHKLQLCLKELRESIIWLRMAHKVQKDALPQELLVECDELIAMLVSSVVKAKKRAEREEQGEDKRRSQKSEA